MSESESGSVFFNASHGTLVYFYRLPLPILWKAMGYGLQNAWSYPIVVDIGTGVTDTVPVLWVFMISATFASRYGLFISHFRWHPDQVKRAMLFYRILIWLIVPLMMAIITFHITIENF